MNHRIEDEIITAHKANMTIRTDPRPKCFLCGSEGKPLYTNLTDHFLDIPGEWTFVECINSACGLIWQNPMPVKTDLAQAYRSYYTHENEGSAEAPVHHRRKNPLVRFLKNLFSLVFVFFPIRNMYLEHVKPGRLLEIGCGNGKRLKRMQRLGWEVTGQEIDPISAAVARASGKCDVFVGELENLAFPENYFDAIITNHVLEHAYDPLVLMRECYRILKPQGRLVIVTPNSESLGHRYFKKDWLGVDPPRHLHIFKTNNLSDLGIKGGFKVVKSWTTIANVPLISWLSFQIKANIHNPVRRFSIAYAPPAILFIFLAALYRLVDRNSGEECVMLTIK